MQFDQVAGTDRRIRAAELVSAAMLWAAKGPDSGRLAKSLPERVQGLHAAIMHKAAVGAGGTQDPEWAGRLADLRRASNAFLDLLGTVGGVFDLLIAEMLRAPARARITIVTTAGAAAKVAEGAPVPSSKLSLSRPELDPVKVAAIVTATKELLSSPSGAAVGLINRALQAGIAGATDVEFFSRLIGDATPIASFGNTSDAVRADLAALLEAIPMAQSQKLHLIVAPGRIRRLALMTNALGAPDFPSVTLAGGSIVGIPIHASDHVDDNALLIDTTGIIADAGDVEIDVATHASLQMSDAPAGGAQPMTSLWQTNSAGIRAVRRFGFEPVRAAVAVLSGVAWGEPTASPGA